MNFKRLWVIFRSRNYEFFRDRSAFGWNFIFPFLIIGGFSLIFGGESYTAYKIGLFPHAPEISATETLDIPDHLKPDHLKNGAYIKLTGFSTFEEGMDRLKTHKIDFLLKIGPKPYQYWMSDSSPKGYMAEKIFISGLAPEPDKNTAVKNEIGVSDIRYIDWLLPGILGMNMMFSALYGVGYVTVRYRKNGVLKRLKATPLTAFEYLAAQLLSRIFVLMFSFSIMWMGVSLIFSIDVQGSYPLLFLVFFMGSMSLTSVGLVLASRGTSEEFTNGVLNFIAWPMMFLSEVWFSLEGAPRWLKVCSEVFPLTPMLRAARSVINNNAGLMDVSRDLTMLLVMTFVCLATGALLFSWND